MRSGTQWLILAGAMLWCIVIVAAPLANLSVVYTLFSAFCHQDPERSWSIAGRTLPVCIRCASIYFGFLIGMIFTSRPRWRFFQVAMVMTLCEFILARLVIDSAWLRGMTGLLLGASAAPFVAQGINEMTRARLMRGSV